MMMSNPIDMNYEFISPQWAIQIPNATNFYNHKWLGLPIEIDDLAARQYVHKLVWSR